MDRVSRIYRTKCPHSSASPGRTWNGCREVVNSSRLSDMRKGRTTSAHERPSKEPASTRCTSARNRERAQGLLRIRNVQQPVAEDRENDNDRCRRKYQFPNNTYQRASISASASAAAVEAAAGRRFIDRITHTLSLSLAGVRWSSAHPLSTHQSFSLR